MAEKTGSTGLGKHQVVVMHPIPVRPESVRFDWPDFHALVKSQFHLLLITNPTFVAGLPPAVGSGHPGKGSFIFFPEILLSYPAIQVRPGKRFFQFTRTTRVVTWINSCVGKGPAPKNRLQLITPAVETAAKLLSAEENLC
jgi:hypothetical protein